MLAKRRRRWANIDPALSRMSSFPSYETFDTASAATNAKTQKNDIFNLDAAFWV